MDENYTTTTTFTGVIYSWINTITDMSYIGSTTNEYNRKAVFLSKAEHGVSAFQYQVLETITAPDETSLKIKLDEREAFYIQKYQTTITGYNTALYGRGQKGIKLSDETKQKMSNSHKKIAVKITDMNNNTTTIFPSMTLANTTLRIPLSSMNRILNLGGGNWKNYKITAA